MRYAQANPTIAARPATVMARSCFNTDSSDAVGGIVSVNAPATDASCARSGLEPARQFLVGPLRAAGRHLDRVVFRLHQTSQARVLQDGGPACFIRHAPGLDPAGVAHG